MAIGNGRPQKDVEVKKKKVTWHDQVKNQTMMSDQVRNSHLETEPLNEVLSYCRKASSSSREDESLSRNWNSLCFIESNLSLNQVKKKKKKNSKVELDIEPNQAYIACDVRSRYIVI